jgi:hypothetical protein
MRGKIVVEQEKNVPFVQLTFVWGVQQMSKALQPRGVMRPQGARRAGRPAQE